MGGGKRTPFNKSKPRRPKEYLFVEGGILAEFGSPLPTTSRGKKSNAKSGSKYKNSGNGTIADHMPGLRSSPANAFRYDYPSVDVQDVLQSGTCTKDKNADGCLIGSRRIILLDSKDSEIVAYEDTKPSMEASEVAYDYEYSSGFVLGECSRSEPAYSEEPGTTAGVIKLSSGVISEEEKELHKGLGFSDKSDAAAGKLMLSNTVQEGEEPSCDSSCHEIEEEDDEGSMDEDDSAMVKDFMNKTSSPEKNSAFVSIGGIKLYTQDISDNEHDEEDEELSDDGDSSEISESDDSEDTSDFDSDVDEDVMEDYLEGIGGSSRILEPKWLALQDLLGQVEDDDRDDDTSDGYDGTLKKLSGVALQDSSREYGKQKQQTKRNLSAGSRKPKPSVTLDSSMDDLMFVKNPRRLSAKKKHITQFPQSWPSEARKSKKFRRYPGEKKKHRKEMIAVKRRERMLRRGVDLEQINLKLKQMVLDNVDMLAFQPMHARDCSQVQRLAAIYRLKSDYQGSGKKRFVTVSRTQHTSMPSAGDGIRLEKFLGASKDDTDFPVVDTPQRVGGRSSQSKSTKNLTSYQESSGKSERKRSMRKPDAYARQPVSFVSSGAMQSEAVQDSFVESKDISNQDSKVVADTPSTLGSFEVHTKGFGSKMMAKMGYVEGEGLGKDGKGMSQPIEVIQRPKSLGLGMTFEESSSEPVKVSKLNGGLPRKATPSIGAFEKHTKGFGSTMMAKMGFVGGMGLGKDSQGMVTPLTAVRRPRARGLGAEDKKS